MAAIVNAYLYPLLSRLHLAFAETPLCLPSTPPECF